MDTVGILPYLRVSGRGGRLRDDSTSEQADHPRDPADIEELARLAAAGDDPALESLLTQIRPAVLRLCSRMLPCREDAEEACQDALLRIATRIGTFEGRSSFQTWMYAVASNSARDTYRSMRRRFAEHPAAEMPTHADPRTTSVIAGTRLDLLDALEDLGAERPELARAVLLRDIAAVDYAEIARLLDVPLGTAKSHIHHARRWLRPRLSASE
jgi:RNA polymerase sigma-70 factor (ECF subfamily)